mgnify:CR=1 FL=1
MAKWVYKFEEGSAAMRNLLGGKGCNLAEMTNLGMPIPQGFTVTTEACTDYYNSGKQITKEIQDQIFEALAWLEGVNGKKFGDTEDPLLVSVRSGARASMPGMMDTILNLGLNDVAVEGFAKKTGNPRFAYDSYRRFIQMYSDVVMEVPKSYFEKIIDEMKEAKGVHYDTELDANDLKELAEKFKAVYKEAMNGEEFPQDPKEQLMGAVKAVFRSWDNPRANVYRRDNDIPYSWGTAVNVQMMAFGNMGDDCGTGVAFTRDPATGNNGLFGEFLTNAQGEDVVAGVRTPMHISEMEQLSGLVTAVPDLAYRLAERFWPGPLTMILPKQDCIPSVTSGGLDTVGIRMPSHPIARRLITLSKTAIAAPSGNRSGYPSPTTAAHMMHDLNGKIAAVIDGGACQVGVESTVICFEDAQTVRILRPGYITKEDLEQVAKTAILDPAILHDIQAGQTVRSPGMKYQHYSPQANVILVEGSDAAFCAYVSQHQTADCYALVFDGEEQNLSIPCLTYGKNSAEQAQHLFDCLRHCDEIGAKTVYVRAPKRDGIGLAVYNRLIRAAGFEVIQL